MTADAGPVFEELLLGVSAGAAFAMAVGMARASRPLARGLGIAFAISVAGYALKLWAEKTQFLDHNAAMPLMALSSSTAGWFQLFVVAIFDDRCRLRPSRFLPTVLLTGSAIAAYYSHDNLRTALWIVCTLLRLGVIGAALLDILRGWKGDLVEARRRMRAGFLGVVCTYILALCVFDTLEMMNIIPAWYPLANAWALCVMCIFGCFLFLEAREVFFAPAVDPAAPVEPASANASPADPVARADLDRLEALMKTGEVWREEGLTIASLAVKANIPETQLRRLINDRLGYRNFPSFVNAHRIRAAKMRLADPNEARTSISAIAFDLGFGSLGPFNRAFREETGASPSEWRRLALAGAPPPSTQRPEASHSAPKVAAE